MIFIGYSSGDRYTVVESLVFHLKNYGFEVWYDFYDMFLGDNRYEENFKKGISGSHYVIFVISKNFFSSNCAKEELDYAQLLYERGEIILFPLLYCMSADELPQEYNCFEKFVNDILSLSICDVLTAFADLYEEQQHIYFKVYDREIFFKTGTMVFDSGTHSIKWTVLDRKNRLDKCREISCFYNQSQYPLLPDDFAVDVGSEKCKLNDLFSNICTNLSLAYLATTSSISENELRIQITGQRILDDVIPLRLQESNEEMYKIYSWVFVDGNPIDKILLARNTVSTHCRFTKITRLDGKTLASIQANYNLYLKKDVEQYIALTNVVAEHIQTSVNNIAECIDKLQNGIKGNLIAVLGFLLSTVLTSGISGRTLDDIFTKDIIAIMYFVLLGSLIYCAVTVSEIIAKQKRILRQYDEILKHYEKILSKEDICEIAGNGETINKAKSELKWEIIMWATVWIVFILIAFMAIDGLENGMHFFDYLLCFVRRVFLSIMRRVWNLIR